MRFFLLLILALFVAVTVIVGAGRAFANEPQARWTYECFMLYSGAVAKLNQLPAHIADTAKFTSNDDSTLNYCVVWKQ